MKGCVTMNNKLEELLNAAKLGDLLHRREAEEKRRTHCVLMILAIIGAVAAVAGIAYAVYRYLTPDYLEDFDDEEETSCDCTNDFGDNATKAASLDETAAEE
jgi:hypothetical protein